MPFPAIVCLAVAIGLVVSDDRRDSVQAIRDRHDRALIAELRAYLEANPQAPDRDAGYLKIFETAIDHDWFLDVEPLAQALLESEPEGGVAPMARIVVTMARAHAGDFVKAREGFRHLMTSLDDERQIAFAADFTQSVAAEAIAAGRTDVAADLYRGLLERFGADTDLRADVSRWQARLELVGQPAPDFEAADLDGARFRLADWKGKGKYILLEFWASWCAPALADRPALLSTYQAHHRDRLEVVSVSLDDDPEAARRVIRQGAWPWRQLHAGSSGIDLLELYRVEQIPASVLIGPDGRIERLDIRAAALDALLSNLPQPASPRTSGGAAPGR
ncbi:MAG: hypothetical protein KatS3mg108_3415 [Isosphaeraceae bacterium]|jgi:thiol-disulfide isomerase/thioredoxin|nr:MAG: hypothetical protein KatS3mg108_3415 [Isosphaeraceae bacterium]